MEHGIHRGDTENTDYDTFVLRVFRVVKNGECRIERKEIIRWIILMRGNHDNLQPAIRNSQPLLGLRNKPNPESDLIILSSENIRPINFKSIID